MNRRWLGLGLALSVIGTAEIFAIFSHIEWYAENVRNDITFSVLLIASVLVAIGGYVMLFAALDNND